MDRPKLANGRGSTSLIWIIVAGLAIIFGGLLISTLSPYILPAVGSAEAQQIDGLFQFMLAIAGMVFLLVQGVIAYSVIRFRAKKDEIADGPPIHGNTTLEFVWTLIPAIIVVVITLYAFSVFTSIRAIHPNEQEVTAVGQRFAWTFYYKASMETLPSDVDWERVPEEVRATLQDGGEIRFSYPQLATWVGQPVHVSLESQDVNHAFWIPGMRVKQDLLAGRVTDIRFTPLEANMYRIVCAELCGGGHGDMAGTLVERLIDGEREPVFQGAWLNVYADEETYLREFYYPELFKVLYPPDDPVVLGEQILSSNRYPCFSCHTLTDLGWEGAQGPPLDGVATRTQRLGATGAATMEDYIHNSLRNPGAYVVPGYINQMPPFEEDEMPESDLQAIIAYLMTQTE
jgi:cytochrome c oxidase subunit 2